MAAKVSLKEHFDALRKADKEHFKALRKADRDYLQSLAAEREKAIEKYEEQAKQWRQQANEWRQTMTDREARFVGTGAFDGLNEKVTELTKRFEKNAGRSSGLHSGWIYLLGGVGLIGTIVTIIGGVVAIIIMTR